MAWPDPASCGRHFNAGDYPYVSIWRAVLRGQRQCRLDCRVAGVHRYVCRRPDGSLLLSRLSEVVLRWAFVVFMAFVILSQLIFVPSRDSSIELNLVTGLLMVVFGVIAGILAGLLGVGGGAILVPSLSILFDASDLIARGTSLLAMFPNAVTTTVANVRRRMVHAKVGLIIGIVAALTAPLGTWIAEAMTPRTGEILFATYLTVLLIRSVWVALKITRK